MTKPKGQAKRWLTNMLRAPIRYCEYKDPPGCAASRDWLTDPTAYAKSYQASQVYQVFARQQLDLLAKFASGDLIYLNCKEPSKSSKSFKYTCLLTTLLPTRRLFYKLEYSLVSFISSIGLKINNTMVGYSEGYYPVHCWFVIPFSLNQ